MATAVDVNTLVDAAITAIDGEDYATARRKLLAASAAMAGIPDQTAGGDGLRYDSAKIENLLNQVNRSLTASRAAGGIQRQRVTFGAVSGGDDCE